MKALALLLRPKVGIVLLPLLFVGLFAPYPLWVYAQTPQDPQKAIGYVMIFLFIGGAGFFLSMCGFLFLRLREPGLNLSARIGTGFALVLFAALFVMTAGQCLRATFAPKVRPVPLRHVE